MIAEKAKMINIFASGIKYGLTDASRRVAALRPLDGRVCGVGAGPDRRTARAACA